MVFSAMSAAETGTNMRSWWIEGFDGTVATFRVPMPPMPKSRVIEILRCLAARNMTADEIFEDSVEDKWRRLRVFDDGDLLRTDGNPHYLARRE